METDTVPTVNTSEIFTARHYKTTEQRSVGVTHCISFGLSSERDILSLGDEADSFSDQKQKESVSDLSVRVALSVL